ncbi:hypothetical protein A2851_02385 [Candidatus Kaiserbacteria bacterium RIFCSPHIGHO2_01_FULL_53_29]|uniref:DUF218 domain-containing protein n=1 Tax=Candidatus Kaiserbacteria bacterium RIFCSPHIGHO2_01_FULL_53_29 TaxID=1798480 RepID=A0A1F6CXF1_9BACT|nr:MAG: hypothetical protein A2851_02385 [Candidatus Kaiserbacteria bacterium RIFCSPHIGHO2_01_FULL_53_29]
MSWNEKIQPNAIAILSGSVKKQGARWVSTALTAKDDEYGAPGQQLRIEAAVLLAHKYPHALLVLSGGRGYESHDMMQPLLSEVMRDELLERGIMEPRIFLEKGSNSTFQQMEAIQKMLIDRTWKRVLIVTNRWHVPRVEAIIATRFPVMNGNVKIIGAEETLLNDSPEKWKSAIDEAYRSEFLKRRIAHEEEGIRQIRNGSYHYR